MGKHTATARGKRVRVKLRDGQMFFDHFIERTRNKTLVFRVAGRIHARDIESFTEVRPDLMSGRTT